MSDEPNSRLVDKATQAAQYRDLCQQPAFKDLLSEIEDRITDKHHRWLSAKTKEDAEEIRIKTKSFQDLLDLIKKKILQGDHAKQTLRRMSDQSTP